MAEIIKMPKMSDTMTEGIIVSWLKKVGDEIQSGDILAEVETDKATMELESYDDGVLLYIGCKEGDKVSVGSVLAIIGSKGEDYSHLLKSDLSQSEKINKEDTISEINNSDTNLKAEDTSVDNKNVTDNNIKDVENILKASPLAKKVAKDMGYDISKIVGSGPGGRIIKKDVENFTVSKNQQKPISSKHYQSEEVYEEIVPSLMRVTIANRLQESLRLAPHFYLTMDINMDKVIEIREKINQYIEKISFNDLITKAVAVSIRRFPKINVAWHHDKIRYNKHINIGVAVAIENGLVVPNLRYADTKTLSDISCEIKTLVSKAKNQKLTVDEMQGSTFCISNLGMFGIESFTSIINPPSACILAIGAIKKIPVCTDKGEIVPGNVMKLTLSCDHRVVDGAVGAEFLSILKSILENPISILI